MASKSKINAVLEKLVHLEEARAARTQATLEINKIKIDISNILVDVAAENPSEFKNIQSYAGERMCW